MANRNDKAQKNVPGRFYVDKSCVCCGQCHEMAPKIFSEDTSNGGMYVAQQPTSETDIQLCQDAIQICPVEAIGDDGE